MKILVTGSNGFVGRNLVENLKNLRDGKDKTRPELKIDEIYEYDINNTEAELDQFCSDCDFVFNLAGVNRPKEQAEFMQGNFGIASTLLDTLKRHHNTCSVMLSSSIQATLIGRYHGEYERSKKHSGLFDGCLNACKSNIKNNIKRNFRRKREMGNYESTKEGNKDHYRNCFNVSSD